MAGNVIKVALIADDRKFKSGFKSAEKATESFGSTASTLAKGLVAGLGVAAAAAVVSFAKDSIRAFSELEQSTGSVESVFGEAADTITRKAAGAANEFGLSMSDFQESASSLGAQLKTTLGLSMDEAADKAVDLTGVASDMAATFGGTTADAVAAISSLLRGERDAIEKYGVSMNDASIEAYALSSGLAASNEELTPQIKSAAALDLLMQQTADSTGQFADESETLAGKQQRLNARLENTKALVGQALSPAMSAGLDITGLFTTAVSDLAYSMLVARGEITEAEKAIRQYEEATGEAIGSTESFFAALIEEGTHLERIAGGKGGFIDAASSADTFGQSVSDALDVIDPGVEVAQKWADTIGTVGREQGLTTEQIAVARDEYEQYIIRAQQSADASEEFKLRQEGLTGASDDLAESTEETTSRMREQFDLIDGRLDTFGNYTRAVDEQKEAQAEVNRLVDEGKRGTPEYLEALEKVAGSHRDVRDAELAVVEAGGMTRNEFVKQQSALGLTIDEANELADKYDLLFTPQSVTHTIRYDEFYRGKAERQRGGPVRGGTPYLVGERGPEVVVPASNGRVVPNSQLRTGAGAGGGPVIVNNITMHLHAGLGTDPNALAKAVYEALQRYQRMNGPLSLDVRMN